VYLAKIIWVDGVMNKDRKSLKAFTATAKSKVDATSAELVATGELDGLRNYQPINESVNTFLARFRKLYLSAKVMRFREWLDEIDDLIGSIR